MVNITENKSPDPIFSFAQIVMYLNNYVDRNALPYARVQGIEEDLGLTGMVRLSPSPLAPFA